MSTNITPLYLINWTPNSIKPASADWRNNMIYIGFKENKRPELIETDAKPTKETHPQYDFVYGPFKTKEEASKYVKAMTGLSCGEG
jgi:hypothetical protein